jgi:hypothetical protein
VPERLDEDAHISRMWPSPTGERVGKRRHDADDVTVQEYMKRLRVSGSGAPSPARAASPYDRSLVSASTCFHQVKLPPFASREALERQLERFAPGFQKLVLAKSTKRTSHMEEMNAAVEKLDVEGLRKLAIKAQAIGGMLLPESRYKVTAAVDAARDAATAINRQFNKLGRAANEVLSEINTRAIDNARMAFLDFDAPVETAPLPSVNVQRFDDLDFEDDETPDRRPTDEPVYEGGPVEIAAGGMELELY